MSAAEAQETLQRSMSSDPGVQLHLDINALYIVLSTQSASKAWHWALYLHIGPRLGWVFYITNLGCVRWEYHCDEAADMAYSATAVSAVKIAEMVPEMHEALRRRIGLDGRPAAKLQDTEQFGPLTCRSWLLQALYELDNEGYVSVLPGCSATDVGKEASSLASTNQHLLEKKMAKMAELRKKINSACCAL
ncbi:hypothetical protein LLEC1_02747 [Akanthomyces lecanii]|uniref:Uncharacterized protein n=1 Tax=Cordyceps confragosa TaxID=2714763 RepID=A0A179I1F2_CORDF|nr:hypothetical protein LLEC1_02747 [Akanthomyces lecanii]